MSYPAGSSLSQVSGIGTIISIGSVTGAGGTETFTPIGEVSDGKFTGRKLATVMTTSFDSQGVARKIATILDYGQFSGTVLRVSNNAGQMACHAAQVARVAYDFKVQLPVDPRTQTTTGDLYTFSAIVTDVGNFDISISKASEFTLTLDIDGATTFTAGS